MTLRTLFARPLRRRPWRFVVTVLGVAAGVASVVSTVAASRAAVAAFTEGVEEVAGRARLEVSRPGGLESSLLATLAPLAELAVIAPVVDDSALLAELEDGVRLLGVDLLADPAVRPGVTPEGDRGAVLELLTGTGVLLPERLADELGVAVGEVVTLVASSRRREVPVVAIIPARGTARVWDRVVVADVAVAQELLGRTGRLDRVELVPRKGVEVDDLRRRLDALLPADVAVAEPSARRRSADQMVASLRFNLGALSAISVLVAGVLVATTLATSVVQRQQLISLLRSLGASRRQVATAVLVEASAIGGVGGVVGVALGSVGARLALASVRDTVSAVLRAVPASEVRLDADLVLGGVGLAVAASLVAAVLPLVEAWRTPPLQGLEARPSGRLPAAARWRAAALGLGLATLALLLARLPAWRGLPLAALGAALALVVIPLVVSGALLDVLARLGGGAMTRLHLPLLRLAAAGLSAGRRRAAWATGSVAVAAALAVAIATLVVSFRVTVEHWTEAGLRADVWVRPLPAATGYAVGRLDPAVVEIAETVFGPGVVDPFYSLELDHHGHPVTLAGAAFDVVQIHGSVPFPGRDSAAVFRRALSEGGVVVNEPFANRFRVAEGDLLELDLPSGVIVRRVTGVFTDFARSNGLVVLDRADFLDHFPGRGPRDMALFLPPEADAGEARRRLLDALAGRFAVEALDHRELRAEVLAAFDRTFAITAALSAVAAVVAVVAVATVLLALIAERRRELATVSVLGGSRHQLVGLVVAESGLVAAAALVLGGVVGLAVGVILVKVVNLQSFGWSLELVVPTAALVELGLWLAVASVTAAVLPAWGALRLETAQVLREET